MNNLVSPESGRMASGVMDISTKSENHELDKFFGFWEVKLKTLKRY